MRTLLLFLSILQLSHSLCPDIEGFELIRNGQCRGLHSRDTLPFDQATTQAIRRCAAIDGQPVIIHNKEHQSYWTDQASPADGIAILGLVCNSDSKKWEWAEGSALNFKPPTGKYAPELDQPCKDRFSWNLHPDGYWNYGTYGYVVAKFFCTTGADDNLADNAEDGLCYQIVDSAASWHDAQKACRKIGGDLASIHNEKKNAFIHRLAVSNGARQGLFIGASLRKDGQLNGKDGIEWIDETAIDYENYYPGFPKEGLGNCLAMDTMGTGQWMNVDCAAALPAACGHACHDNRHSEENAIDTPICTGEEYKEEGIITSPGYPNSASTPCDYILSVAAGKKIQLEIINLEANTCCDAVNIYTGYLGAPLAATVTGEVHNHNYTSSSNILRVSWQPNGGVNVKGLMMTYRAV